MSKTPVDFVDLSTPTETPALGKRAQNRLDKTQQLAEAAIQLFLERGIEATTIDDITQRANTAKGSFYRYFTDKTALVAYLYEPLATHLDTAFIQCAESLSSAHTRLDMIRVYRVLGGEIAKVVLQHGELVLLYLQECRAPSMGARAPVAAIAVNIAKHARLITEIAHTQKLLRDIPPSVSSLTVIGAVERLLFAVLKGEEVGDPLEIPRLLTSLILDGLRVRKVKSEKSVKTK